MTMPAIARHTAQAAELRAYLQAALTVDPWAAMKELVHLADSPCRSRGS
jgi:hypothetical protein